MITHKNTQYIFGAKEISAYGKMPKYIGKLGIRENGRALYTITCDIMRLSRGDAIIDAHKLANQIIMQNFNS